MVRSLLAAVLALVFSAAALAQDTSTTWRYLQASTAEKHERARATDVRPAAGLEAAERPLGGLDLVYFQWASAYTKQVDGAPRFAVAGIVRSKALEGTWVSFVRVEFGFYTADDTLLETRSAYAIGAQSVRLISTGEYITALGPGGGGIFDVVSTYGPGTARRWELHSVSAETYAVEEGLLHLDLRELAIDGDSSSLLGLIGNWGPATAHNVVVTAIGTGGGMDVASAPIDGVDMPPYCGTPSPAGIPAQRQSRFAVPFGLTALRGYRALIVTWEEDGLSHATETFAASGGAGSFTVVRSCGWSATSDVPWISVTGGNSGSGPAGVVSFSVEPNAGDSRHGTITVSGMLFTVTQAGGGACEFLASPSSLVIGSSVVVQRFLTVAAAPGCGWSAASDAAWLAPLTTHGTGASTIGFSAAPNLTPSARTATLHFGHATVSITQSPASRSADFNGDGRLDLIHASGELHAWLMAGLDTIEVRPFAGGGAKPPWTLVGTGDLNGDGSPDLVWQSTYGDIAAWPMLGLNPIGGGQLSPARVDDTDWKIRSVVDLDADGRVDFIWQHRDGRVGVWFMDGMALRTTAWLGPGVVADLGWTIVGSGDFNADGSADLIWQHSDGRVAAWLMRGAMLLDGQLLSPERVDDTGWRIRAVGDIDGDDWPDLIWQHDTSGLVAAWRMRGTTLMSGELLPPSYPRPSAGGSIVSPR